MHPVLFEIPLFGGIPIHSYGVLVATAFLAGSWWMRREAARVGQDPEKALDLVFWVIVAALVGSRVLYLLVTDPMAALKNPLLFFKLWEGGLVFYGGFIGAMLVGIWFVRRHRLPAFVMTDICAQANSLGHAIGRIGCFFAGCCHGRAVDGHPWYALVFPDVPKSSAPPGIPLYPTQLMEAGGELLIFGLLMLIRRKKRFDGQIIATYMMAYAVLRSVIEYFRGDMDRGFVIDPWLSTSQFISLLLFAIGVSLYIWRWRWVARSSVILLLMMIASCSRPLITARILPHIEYYSRQYDTTTNDLYYAVRDTLTHAGYSVASEQLSEGTILTTWVPVTSDSHYIPIFGRRDYAPSGAYHQLEILISKSGDYAMLKIGSRMKSLTGRLTSSGKEEKKVLTKVAAALRKHDPDISNLGVEE